MFGIVSFSGARFWTTKLLSFSFATIIESMLHCLWLNKRPVVSVASVAFAGSEVSVVSVMSVVSIITVVPSCPSCLLCLSCPSCPSCPPRPSDLLVCRVRHVSCVLVPLCCTAPGRIVFKECRCVVASCRCIVALCQRHTKSMSRRPRVQCLAMNSCDKLAEGNPYYKHRRKDGGLE